MLKSSERGSGHGIDGGLVLGSDVVDDSLDVRSGVNDSLEASAIDGVLQASVVEDAGGEDKEGEVRGGHGLTRDVLAAISPSGFPLVHELRLVVDGDVQELLSAVSHEEGLTGVLNVTMILVSLIEPLHLVGLLSRLGGEAVLDSEVLEDSVLLVSDSAVFLDQDGEAGGAVVSVLSLGFLPFLAGDTVVLEVNTAVGEEETAGLSATLDSEVNKFSGHSVLTKYILYYRYVSVN